MNLKRALAVAAALPLTVVAFAGAANAAGQHDYDHAWEINYSSAGASCDHQASVEDEDGNAVNLGARIKFFTENAANPNTVQGFTYRATDNQGSGTYRDSEAFVSSMRIRYYDDSFSKASSPRGAKLADITYTKSVRDGKHISGFETDGVKTAIVSTQWTNTGSNDGGDSFQLTCVVNVEDAQ